MVRVFANTDIEEQHSDKDTPMVGEDTTPPPISGWMEAKGVVEETTPNGDQVLVGAAANQEALASNPRGPANAAQSARSLYRRVVEMFPNSPLAPEAAWRAADIQWQIEKADASTMESAHERDPVYRMGMDEDALRKVIKYYPRTRWAAFAAFDLIDNKLCGDWEGTTQCPEKEADIYLKYADEYPDGPRTARALYEAAYRFAVLKDMYDASGDDRKSNEAHNQARDNGVVHAVDSISFDIRAGETLALVGEFGSGKSVTALSILRLLREPAAQISGEIFYGGKNLLSLSRGEMRKIRGKEIGMIFQEPMTSLNPVFTIGEQIAETVRAHDGLSRREAVNKAVRMLRAVKYSHARTQDQRLSPSSLGRHETARHARYSAVLQAEAASRGRAYYGTRRHYPGANARFA